MSRRTTLQPIERPAAGTPVPVSVPSSVPSGARAWNISKHTLLACVVIVSGGVLVTGLVLAGRPTPSPAPSPPPVAAPDPCPSVASFLDVLTSYERQARWGLAVSTAQTALRTPALCESDRAALGQKLVVLSREALFEQPPAPEDAPGQRRIATAYADLKTLSAQYGVPPPPPLQIARSASDNRLFLLATVAYADAFKNGESSAEDREVVRADYTAQYNLGLSWSQRADVAQRQEGLARLATACRIDERDQLGSPEACTRLQALLGPRGRWPATLPDPLIDTLPPVAAGPGS